MALAVSLETGVVGSWAALDALQSLAEGTKLEPTGTGEPDSAGTMVVAGVGTVVGDDPAADQAGRGQADIRRRRTQRFGGRGRGRPVVGDARRRGRRGGGRRRIGRDQAAHRSEVQGGRLAQGLQGALGVLDPGQVDDHVAALTSHIGVGDAESIDPPLDDRHRLVQLGRVRRALRLEDHGDPALQVQPEQRGVPGGEGQPESDDDDADHGDQTPDETAAHVRVAGRSGRLAPRRLPGWALDPARATTAHRTTGRRRCSR